MPYHLSYLDETTSAISLYLGYHWKKYLLEIRIALSNKKRVPLHKNCFCSMWNVKLDIFIKCRPPIPINFN